MSSLVHTLALGFVNRVDEFFTDPDAWGYDDQRYSHAPVAELLKETAAALPEEHHVEFYQLLAMYGFTTFAKESEKKGHTHAELDAEHREYELAQQLRADSGWFEGMRYLEENPNKYVSLTFMAEFICPATSRYQLCRILSHLGYMELDGRKWVATERGISTGLFKFEASAWKARCSVYTVVQGIINNWMSDKFRFGSLVPDEGGAG